MMQPENALASNGLTPPLKWAGGKRWLVPHLIPIWQAHQHRRLVEPFCGGLAVTLGLQPQRALLNDMNPHVINLYRWLDRGLTLTIDLRYDSEVYYTHRATFNRLIRAGQQDTSHAAELFYYLNRTGYNGLCRFNRKGDFNVPFGRHRYVNYRTEFDEFRGAFSNFQFSIGSFEALTPDPDDFIYADPPYDVEFVSYSKEGFTWADQVRLVEWLSKHPGPIVLSNQATERIVQLYTEFGFDLHYYNSPRRISNTGDRTPAREVLATKRV
ncbi:MAG: Dam family site-specific DNA-(adenine-N6)-methyltransferase [Anaerolineae bacterium]|nr:Dam family site-specific DNA-(adenine-N6)-methyltransferase [Anaerolineae bacterium]